MGRGQGKKRAGIDISKPEPPPFLQRLREEIIANEDADRRIRSEKRKERSAKGNEDIEDGPTVVKLNDDDLTEEEYKRMKLELETQYKLVETQHDKKLQIEDLDVDSLIKVRQQTPNYRKDSRPGSSADHSNSIKGVQGSVTNVIKAKSKDLNYGSSSEDDD